MGGLCKWNAFKNLSVMQDLRSHTLARRFWPTRLTASICIYGYEMYIER